jgi:prophage regulatory protein
MPIRILNRRDTCHMVSISATQLDRLVNANKFPQPVWLSPKRKGWVENEIEDWLQSKIKARATSASQGF